MVDRGKVKLFLNGPINLLSFSSFQKDFRILKRKLVEGVGRVDARSSDSHPLCRRRLWM